MKTGMLKKIAAVGLAMTFAVSAVSLAAPQMTVTAYAESSDWSKQTRKASLAALDKLLDRTLKMETGTAGSSLKQAALAADYMKWGFRAPIAALQGQKKAKLSKTAIRNAVKNYVNGLTAAEKKTFKANMNILEDLYEDFVDDPAENLNLLLDAGKDGDILNGVPVIPFEIVLHQAGVVNEAGAVEDLLEEILEVSDGMEGSSNGNIKAASKLADWGMVSIATKRQIKKGIDAFWNDLTDAEKNQFVDDWHAVTLRYESFLNVEKELNNLNLLSQAGLSYTGFPYNYTAIPRVTWLMDLLSKTIDAQ